jgi:hypothetical protein
VINVKAAVKAAAEYMYFVKEQLGDQFGGDFQDVRLEEVELSENRNYWLITFGYCPGTRVFRDREYKIFKVNATDSQVESMRIRQL